MKVKLSQYLDRIETKYREARKEWEKIQSELEAEENRFNGIHWEDFSMQGVTNERVKHEGIKKALYEKLEAVRISFNENVDNVIGDSDKVFDSAFRFTPDKVDQNGVAILQNGALSIPELIELGEKYRTSGNYTMYFMVAEKLKSDKPLITATKTERDGIEYYLKAKSRRDSREDHELLKGFGEVCLYGLRDVKVLADGTHGVHEEGYTRYKNACDEITSEISSPWD